MESDWKGHCLEGESHWMGVARLKITTKISIYNLSDLFMWLFMLLTFIVTSISSASVLFQARFVVLAVSGLLGYFQLCFKTIRNTRIILFIAVCVLSWGMAFLLRGEGAYSPNLFLYSFLYMGMGINLASHRHDEFYSKVLFYMVCGMTMFRLLVLHEPIRGFLKDGTTYNFISVLLLLFLCYYCIELCQNQKRIPYIVAIVFAWLSILVYGRGGIVAGLAFLALVTFIGTKDEVNKKKKRLLQAVTALTVIAGIGIIVVYYRKSDSGLFQRIFEKFYRGESMSVGRFAIWSQYLKECSRSLANILFGADATKVFEDGNLHNSFFQMHSCFGLIPTFVLIYAFFRLAVYTYKNKYYYLLCVLLTLSIRSMSDKTAFQGYCEPLFYYMVFCWFNISEKRRMIPKRTENQILTFL